MLILSALDEVCSSATMGIFLYVLKKIITITQIVAPILLIISLAIIFIKGMFDPENKKLMNKIRNAIIATMLIFFMPLCFNIVMNATENTLSFSKCYSIVNYAFKDNSPTYIEIDEGKTKKKIVSDKSKYKNSPQTEDYDDGYASNYLNNDFLSAVSYINDYVKNDKKNSWYYGYSGSKKTFDSAVSSGVKNLTCVVLPNWALKKIGVLKSNQMVYQNPNTMEVKYKNGAEEAIKKHGNIYLWNSAVNFQFIEKSIGLFPGDIIIYNYNHFNVFAGKTGTKMKFYSAGHDAPGHYKNGEYYFEGFSTTKNSSTKKTIIGLIRINK